MHGIIFASLYDYALETLGGAATREIFAGRVYTMSDAHPDEELNELLERTATASGRDRDDLLRAFGAFTATRTFARLYPAFFDIAGDTRTFLLSVETRIHELVRATIPNARPPELRVLPDGDDGVAIEYSSPRRLCRLLEGLVIGTGRRYSEPLEIRETACMREGAPACRFEVRIGS